MQIVNVNIPVSDGAHLDMAFGFMGHKSFLNIQLPDIAGVVLMEMGQDNIVISCQFGNSPFIAAHIVKPYGISIPNDTDVCRQRIIRAFNIAYFFVNDVLFHLMTPLYPSVHSTCK